MSCYQIEATGSIITKLVSYSDPYFQIVYQNNTVQFIYIPGEYSVEDTLIVKAINNLNPIEYPIETYKLIIDFLFDHSLSQDKIKLYFDQFTISKDPETIQEIRFIDYKRKYLDHVITDRIVTELPRKLQETLLNNR